MNRPTWQIPGKHRWGKVRDMSATRSLFRCAKCGVEVETPAPFPDTAASEIWGGLRIGRNKPRPRCSDVQSR